MDRQVARAVSVPNKGPKFTVSTSILTSIAAVLVIYRLSWRWMRSEKLSADDIIIAASMVCIHNSMLRCRRRLTFVSRLCKL